MGIRTKSLEELDRWYNKLGENTEQMGRRLGINGRTVRDLMGKLGLYAGE